MDVVEIRRGTAPPYLHDSLTPLPRKYDTVKQHVYHSGKGDGAGRLSEPQKAVGRAGLFVV